MENNILKLYKNINGASSGFPSNDNQIIITEWQYDAKRMGGAPMITATIEYQDCLDDVWQGKDVYTIYKGRRFKLKNTPTSSYSSSSIMYKHECTFVGKQTILDSIYFYDRVDPEVQDLRSNNTKFVFFGTLEEFARRANSSLVDTSFRVGIDESVGDTEAKFVSFDKKYMSEALQEAYKTWGIPYYFPRPDVVMFGYSDSVIDEVFKYGDEDSLISITKNNSNTKIINKITGTGSADNVPFYYPNQSEKGELGVETGGGLSSTDVTIINASKFSKNVSFEEKLTYTSVSGSHIEASGYKYSISDSAYNTYDTQVQIERPLNDYSTQVVSFLIDDFFVNSNYDSIKLDYEVRITLSAIIASSQDATDYNIINCRINPEFDVVTYDLEQIAKNPSYTTFKAKGLKKGHYKLKFDVEIPYNGHTQTPFTTNIQVSVTGTLYDNITKVWVSDKSTSKYFVDLVDVGLRLESTPTVGDWIKQISTSYIQPQEKLMPSIYRNSGGYKSFYTAKNYPFAKTQDYVLDTDMGEYEINGMVHNNLYKDNGGNYYVFPNPIDETITKEYEKEFDDVKPTIKGMTNANNVRIDSFVDFAYDENDSNDTDENGKYLHPFFFAKLPVMNGTYGFNLFDHAIEEEEMSVSFTSGKLGACECVIKVGEDTQKNLVQVDSNGDLLRDENGNVLCGRTEIGQPKVEPQDRQNDTRQYSVWLCLEKDTNTFGVPMPYKNADIEYRPDAEDNTFVFLHIELPKAYVLAAENKLARELIAYMALSNSEHFNFSISFSRIYFQENPTILANLSENSILNIEYNGHVYPLYVRSYTYKKERNAILPSITVELAEELTASDNPIDSAIDGAKTDLLDTVFNADMYRNYMPYFLRKDIDDTARGNVNFERGLQVGESFRSGLGGQGGVFRRDQDGTTYLEADRLYIRMKAYFDTIEVREWQHTSGNRIASLAGIKCTRVTFIDDNGDEHDVEVNNTTRYRCYFRANDGEKLISNNFAINDFAYCKRTDLQNAFMQHFYWRLVVGKNVNLNDDGEGYIELLKANAANGSDVPMTGDDIIQLGNTTDTTRQGAIIENVSGEDAPRYEIYQGINSYSFEDKCYISLGYNTQTNHADMKVYGDAYIGARDGSTYVRYNQTNSQLDIKAIIDIMSPIRDGNTTQTLKAILDAIEEEIGQQIDVAYLTNALQQNTTIIGGLILSSLIALRNSSGYVMSGINGISDSSLIGDGIAAWYGGAMVDGTIASSEITLKKNNVIVAKHTIPRYTPSFTNIVLEKTYVTMQYNDNSLVGGSIIVGWKLYVNGVDVSSSVSSSNITLSTSLNVNAEIDSSNKIKINSISSGTGGVTIEITHDGIVYAEEMAVVKIEDIDKYDFDFDTFNTNNLYQFNINKTTISGTTTTIENLEDDNLTLAANPAQSLSGFSDGRGDVTLQSAKSLFRFDGSGYLANGNISWNNDGSGQVANNNIRWDSRGNLNVNGIVNANMMYSNTKKIGGSGYTIDPINDPCSTFLISTTSDMTITLPDPSTYDGLELNFYQTATSSLELHSCNLNYGTPPSGSTAGTGGIYMPEFIQGEYNGEKQVWYAEVQFGSYITLKAIDGKWYHLAGDLRDNQ